MSSHKEPLITPQIDLPESKTPHNTMGDMPQPNAPRNSNYDCCKAMDHCCSFLCCI